MFNQTVPAWGIVGARLLLVFIPLITVAGCGASSGADSIGRGDSCQISDSRRPNGRNEVAEVRESTCETSAEFLAPNVTSMFVFVHDRSAPKDANNVVLRYEVVCPDTGNCAYAPPRIQWLAPSSLHISPATYGDIYCVQRTAIDGISIKYSEAPLRNPPQNAFTSLDGLCR